MRPLRTRTHVETLLSSVFVVMATLGGFGVAQTPKPKSSCLGSGCDAMSRADLFIKTFASSGDSKGLRTSQLEQEEQVRLAFYGIDSTRLQIERGKLTENEGNFIIDGHEKVIRNYVHDKTNDAMIKAATGQATDIPTINKSLGGLLSVARQDALLGHEALAMQAQEKMVKVLTTFSQQFAETCQQQTFPIELPLVLERQNLMMGTGISLTHCMNRKVSAELSKLGVQYRFETCSGISDLYSLLQEKWDLKLSGRVVGNGVAEKEWWEAKFLFEGHQVEMGGQMKIFTQEVEIKEESVKIPEDAGPNARSNGRPSAPMPKLPQEPKKGQVLKIGIAPLYFWNRGVSGDASDAWIEGEAKRENKPCNS